MIVACAPAWIGWGLFALAFGCAGLMGYAIQRGATCMVAAVGELIEERRATRIIALAEAALWVAGGLSLVAVAGAHIAGLISYRATLLTLAGGALLGLGALINRACVFGAIARLGSGEWAYIATPVGFLIGCLLVDLSPWANAWHAVGTPIERANWGFVLAISAPLALWRGGTVIAALRQHRLSDHIWSPHVATAIIGIAFVVMMLAVGSWAYTDALAQLARGMSMDSVERIALFFGLLGGAVLGGWTAGMLQARRPGVGVTLRCLVGGMLMGVGSLLIPGGNDGLILVGLPLLQEYALIALLAMAATIAAGLLLRSSSGVARAATMR